MPIEDIGYIPLGLICKVISLSLQPLEVPVQITPCVMCQTLCDVSCILHNWFFYYNITPRMLQYKCDVSGIK